jgi:Oxidoreductase FAD-binding domain
VHWHEATVRDVVAESGRAHTIVLDVPEWPGHRAGQHVDVRLTAEDGYQAQRSYSIASAPEQDALELTVELVDDGEVSQYLVEDLRAGDSFELRGPIGGHFTWSVADGGPLLLLAGGSGLVPLMSMLRHRAAGLDRLGAARRRGDAGRARAGTGGAAAGLRLRPDVVRRARRGAARRRRARPGRDPHRALRTHGRMR